MLYYARRIINAVFRFTQFTFWLIAFFIYPQLYFIRNYICYNYFMEKQTMKCNKCDKQTYRVYQKRQGIKIATYCEPCYANLFIK